MARRASLAPVRAPSLRPALRLPAGRARSVLAWALAGVAAAGLAYAAARETSLFALRAVEVTGAPTGVAEEVRRALRPLEGESLVALSPGEIEERLLRVPTVRAASVDRAFPHTLAVAVEPERPLAVLRAGKDAWLVAESGRVIAAVEPDARPRVPRIRVAVDRPPAVGATLAGDEAAAALRVLDAVPRRFPERVRFAAVAEDGVALTLVSRLEVRLGEPVNLGAKLAAAAAVLAALPEADRAVLSYLDASVPARVVAGADAQPESESLEFAAEVPANAPFDSDPTGP